MTIDTDSKYSSGKNGLMKEELQEVVEHDSLLKPSLTFDEAETDKTLKERYKALNQETDQSNESNDWIKHLTQGEEEEQSIKLHLKKYLEGRVAKKDYVEALIL